MKRLASADTMRIPIAVLCNFLQYLLLFERIHGKDYSEEAAVSLRD